MKKAQSLIEYTLILVLISAVAVSLLHFLGKKMSLAENDMDVNTKKDRIESMNYYCSQKKLIYDKVSESCVVPNKNSLDNSN